MAEGPDAFAAAAATPEGTAAVDIRSKPASLSNGAAAPARFVSEEREREERCWATEKERIEQSYCLGLPEDVAAGALMVGTTGTRAYALVGASARSAQLVVAHKRDCLARIEHSVVCRGWRAHIEQLRTRLEAKRLLSSIMTMCKVEPALRPLVQRHISRRLTRRLKTLPEGDDNNNISTTPLTPASRAQLHVYCMEFNALPPDDEEENKKDDEDDCELYALWTCNMRKWKAACELRVSPGSIPEVAFNARRVAFVYQPHERRREGAVCVRVTEGKRVVCEFSFAFPTTFGNAGGGLLGAHLSEQDVLTVTLGGGVVVCDLSSSNGGAIDRLHAAYLSEGSVAVTSASATRELLVMGTATGVCFGVHWRSGRVQWVECAPFPEPVLSYSDGLMHTMMGVCGRMRTGDFSYVWMPRPLDFAVCGTLLFALEKYGSVQIFSTVARNIVFPFKPPPEYAPPPTSQYRYRAVSAEPKRVTCLYPDGTVRIFVLKT